MIVHRLLDSYVIYQQSMSFPLVGNPSSMQQGYHAGKDSGQVRRKSGGQARMTKSQSEIIKK
jgi:hypothetical protein